MSNNHCLVIGIAGASGSGKTLLATTLYNELQEQCSPSEVAVICEDYYYNDQTNVPFEERLKVNYDHPASMDHAYLIKQLQMLKRGKAVELPQYDYCTHTRSTKTLHLTPPKIIILEGILLFTDDALRKEIDYCVFVDAPLDICLIRRIARDMKERARSFESVVTQYLDTVRPMYLQFIEPSRQHADLVVPSWKENKAAVAMVKAKLSEHLCKKESNLEVESRTPTLK